MKKIIRNLKIILANPNSSILHKEEILQSSMKKKLSKPSQ